MRHRPEIDGLRALGIIPVMLYHAGFQSFSGGYTGVDIFFVISGYLISTIILEDIKVRNFSITNFYERRLRRVLPSLFIVICFALILGFFFLTPVEYKSLGGSVIAVATFTSNIYFWKTSDYFDPNSELRPLINTWSLAVEEQFYIFFPILLVILAKVAKDKIFSILCAITLAGCLLSLWGSIHYPIFSFYLLPTRFYELLIGAVCSVIILERKKFYLSLIENRSIFSVIGLMLIAYAIIYFDRSLSFPGLYALIPTVGTGLLILFCTDSSALGSILSNKFMTTIGLISYGTFLWFQPIFSYARISKGGEPSGFQFILLIVISLIMGWVSWKFIETPIRNKSIFTRKFIFLWSSLLSIALVSIGYGLLKTEGLERFYIQHRLSYEELKQYDLLKKYTGKNLYELMTDDSRCNFWAKTVSSDFIKRYENCSIEYGEATVVIGDSHAMNLYNILAKTGQYKFIVGISQGGCRPYDNYPNCDFESLNNFILKHKKQIKNVIYNQSGTKLLLDINGKGNIGKLFYSNLEVTINKKAVNALMNYLKDLSSSVNVILTGPFLEPLDSLEKFKALNMHENKFNQKLIYEYSKLDQYLKLSTEEHLIQYISLLILFDQESYGLANNKCILYNDADHFSTCGEEIFSERLKFNKKNLF